MNHCVPDFEMDDDYAIPSSSSPSHNNLMRPKKTAIGGGEEIMELLWQNGQVVLQSQNQRSFNKSPNGGVVGGGGEAEIPAAQQSTAREIRSLENENMPNHHHHHHQLFMQEDEMASWLHYPLDDSSFDRDLYSDLLYPQPSAPVTTATPSTPPRESRATIATEIRPPPPPAASLAMPPRPPIPPPSKRADSEAAPRVQNFMHFSRLPPHARTAESGPSSSSKAAREFTVVDSNVTPTAGPESRVSHAADSTTQFSGGNVGFGTTSFTPAPATSRAARDLTTACELTVTSSPGGSGGSVSVSASASASAEQPPRNHKPSASTAEDRKRKGRETDDNECHSEDVEFESADVKKQARGSTSTKRSRAAEVHNLSERRRRDRINGSDGRIIPDFIAEYAKLSLIPPYLQTGYHQLAYGVNFASGGAGALAETYSGLVIGLQMQLRNFKKVEKQLRLDLGKSGAKRLVSNAVYLFNVGSGDYLADSSGIKLYTPEDFAAMVVGNITAVFKEIYKKGGRKFGILSLGHLGCLPELRATNVAAGGNGECMERFNALAKLHNLLLAKELKKLENHLEGFKYSYFDTFAVDAEMFERPSKYGFKEVKSACCGSGPYRGAYSCGGKREIKEYELCDNPQDYFFFDSGHPSQEGNQRLAELMWGGPSNVAGPYNLKSLFQLTL